MAVKSKKTKKTKTKSKSCPTCGSVECFERPRFFAGQLLTDKDLDAAQRYVIEKNRLHNRYLVGTGVVCGLAVRCHPSCNGFVIVDSGYAIDCCGNDIVLCDAFEFDVIKYLEECFKKEEPFCNDPIRTRRTNCDEGPKEYCLVLSYNEEHTHPITALIRDNGCTNSRCEPSRTSETFRLDLIEKQENEQKTAPPYFWDRIQQCEEWRRGTGALEFDGLEGFKILKASILKFYKRELETRCNLAEELQAIEDEFRNPDTIETARARLRDLVEQLQLECFCKAFLVPCVECDPEAGVLLACLTVQDGKILKICNNVRQQVITGSMLRYFLSPPLNANLGNWLTLERLALLHSIIFSNFPETVCCEDDFNRDARRSLINLLERNQ